MSSDESFCQPWPRIQQSTRTMAWGGAALLSMLVVAYAFWFTLHLPSNVDVSWLLVVCNRLLDGERMPTEVMEINPPFSVWLYMPFMVLERVTRIHAELWLVVGVIAASLGSLALSFRLLARTDMETYNRPLAIWALPFVLFVVLCLFPAEFAQREHFAALALLPWLALQIARQRSSAFSAGTRWERVLAGGCAAIVVMVKPPHFALAIMLPSLALAFSRKSPKPLFVAENMLGATVVAAYATYIVLFQESFLTEVLPFVSALYLPLRLPLLPLLLGWPEIVVLLAAVTAVAAGGIGRLAWDVRVPLLSAIGFIPAFVVMGKGWPNHALPMLVAVIIGFTLQLVRMDLSRLFTTRKAFAALGLFIVLSNVARIQEAAFSLDSKPLERSVAAIKSAVQRPTIVSLAARLQPAHPLTRRVDGRYVSRYPSAWPVYNAVRLANAAHNARSRRRLTAASDNVIGELAAEIAEKRPDIVLYSDETGARWDKIVLGDPRIAESLQNYSVLHREPSVTVYLRDDLSTAGQALSRELKGRSPASASD